MSPLCTCNTILAKRLFLCDQTPYVHRGDDGTRSKPKEDRKLVLRVQAIGAKVTHMYRCSIFLCLFSPKAPRLTRRGRLRLSFQFRIVIEKHDKKLASFPGIYNHSLGVREGAVSRYFSSGSTNFGSNLGPYYATVISLT